MAMKSYTDLEQSKKLVEILPSESADMCFNLYNNSKMPPLMTPYSRFDEFYDMGKTPDFLIPCWSLAALLEIIPERLYDKDGYSYDIEITKQNGLCYINYEPNGGGYQFEGSGPADTMVDACVEMINKLKEVNLL